MYRRSRLGARKAVADSTYVEGSDFDEHRAQLKADRAERQEWPFGRENHRGYL